MLQPQKFGSGFRLSISTPAGVLNFYSMSESRLTLTNEAASALLERYESEMIPGIPLGINVDQETTFPDKPR